MIKIENHSVRTEFTVMRITQMTNTFKTVIFSDTSIIDQEILPIINSEGKEDFGMCLTVTTGYAAVEIVLDYIELKNALKYMQDTLGD